MRREDRKTKRKEEDYENLKKELEREIEDERNGYYYKNMENVTVKGKTVVKKARRPSMCSVCKPIGCRKNNPNCPGPDEEEGNVAKNEDSQ